MFKFKSRMVGCEPLVEITGTSAAHILSSTYMLIRWRAQLDEKYVLNHDEINGTVKIVLRSKSADTGFVIGWITQC